MGLGLRSGVTNRMKKKKKKIDPFFVKGRKRRDAREYAKNKREEELAIFNLLTVAADKGWEMEEVEGGLMLVEPGVTESKVHFITAVK